jgi:hypothetical protein
MSAPLKVIPVTIPNGQSLSNGALVGDYRISGLQFPATWAAGGISWQASLDDGATWVEVSDSTGAPIAYPVAGTAGAYMLLDSTKFVGLTLVKIRSGTLAAPVNQGANCVLKLVCAKLNPLY